MESLLVVGWNEDTKEFASVLSAQLNLKSAAEVLERATKKSFTHFSFVANDHCYWSGRKEDL